MMITPRSSAIRSIQTCLVLAVVATCAIASGDASTSDRDRYCRQIAEKSESERARLQHNFREFRGLSAEVQKALRQLNDDLKEDDREQGPLRGIMNQYHDWLAMLTPGQRDDLRRQTDPNAREKRVRELLKEQQERVESKGPAGGARGPRGLSSDDLSSVLGVVEKALLDRQVLADEEKAQLNRKVGLARHMYVMELAYRRPGVPPRQQVGFTPRVADAMIA